jgi:uncharacterized spore protein YtfJ
MGAGAGIGAGTAEGTDTDSGAAQATGTSRTMTSNPAAINLLIKASCRLLHHIKTMAERKG